MVGVWFAWGGGGKDTTVRGLVHVSPSESSGESLRGPIQVRNKLTQQTYLDLLLVNIKLIYPHWK